MKAHARMPAPASQQGNVSERRFARRPVVGLLLSLFGLLLIPFSCVLSQILPSIVGEAGLPRVVRVLLSLFLMVAIPFGAAVVKNLSGSLRRQGRSYSTVADAREVLSSTHLPPVLYLRSFREAAEGELGDSRKTVEELISSGVRDVGPLIAVGNPADRTAVLGAARFYLREDVDWQTFVEGLMAEARLIIINGEFLSDGLVWEIKRALELVDHEKVIFHFINYRYLPEDRPQTIFTPAAHIRVDGRLEVQALLESLLKRPVLGYGGDAYFLRFETDGTPRFAGTSAWAANVFRKDSIQEMQIALRSLIAGQGVKVGRFNTAILAFMGFLTLRRAALILLVLFLLFMAAAPALRLVR